MLNKAREIMKQRESMIKEAQETLVVLGATIVNNQIVINKGKVTAIEITREDNSTIEMLRETIRQMNQNMNDMIKQHEEEITKLKEQYEQQMLDMTSEFEYEVECIVNKREKQIKELEEKLDFKELLLSEFNENMDEKIKTIHGLEDKIEELKDELEVKDTIIENLKEQLKAEKEKQPRIVYVEVADDPTYNDEPEEKPIRKQQTKEKQVFDLAYEELESHDGAKVKVKDLKNNIVFYALIGKKKGTNEYYDRPSLSLDGRKYTRGTKELAHLYKYDEQVTEVLMNKINKRFNLQQTAEENINDEQEIVVNVTNDKHVEIHVDEDPMAGAEDLDL